MEHQQPSSLEGIKQQYAEGEPLAPAVFRPFFLEMADPSLDTLTTVTTTFVAMPLDHLEELRSAGCNTGAEVWYSSASLTASGEDREVLARGVGNSVALLDDIVHNFDFETKTPWNSIDPKKLAVRHFENIQHQKAERVLEDAVVALKSEPDLAKRSRLAYTLKKQVFEYIERFHVSFYGKYDTDRKAIEPTWKRLTSYLGWIPLVKLDNGHIIAGSNSVRDAIHTAYGAITRNSFEKKLEKLPQIDKVEWNALRLEYGAKAAGLMLLSGVTGDINKLRRRPFGFQVAVPEFQAIPASLYSEWKQGTDIDDKLHTYYDWANSLKEKERWGTEEAGRANYVVRSSAVYSEDGEGITGAGIYDSLLIRSGSSFEDFKKAVTQVYQSTDSEQAQNYRRQHGIPNEEMGIVIQKYADSHHFHTTTEGYANARLSGVPQLMEIVTSNSRNFLKRNELDFFLELDSHSHDDAFENTHQFPPDIFQVHGNELISVGQVVMILERIWGKDIQIEFVGDGLTINVVQVRELPKDMTTATEIQFPDQPHIHSGAAIGIGDMELNMLDDGEERNVEKEGVVVFRDNFMWTSHGSPDYLPKSGAVIITGDEGSHGHIQTLCTEKGLICIFPDKNNDERTTLFYSDFRNFNRLRVVSNGLEGRVYPINAQEDQ